MIERETLLFCCFLKIKKNLFWNFFLNKLVYIFASASTKKMVQTYGVIGNTPVFGSGILGSSPSRSTFCHFWHFHEPEDYCNSLIFRLFSFQQLSVLFLFFQICFTNCFTKTINVSPKNTPKLWL